MVYMYNVIYFMIERYAQLGNGFIIIMTNSTITYRAKVHLQRTVLDATFKYLQKGIQTCKQNSGQTMPLSYEVALINSTPDTSIYLLGNPVHYWHQQLHNFGQVKTYSSLSNKHRHMETADQLKH